MRPSKQALELFLLAKEDWESCAGLVKLNIGRRVVCFLAQQTVEKCFKAVLAQHNVTYPYTHDLLDLEKLLQSHRVVVPITSEQLDMLNPFAVEIRYGLPDMELPASQEVLSTAEQTLAWCKKELHE